MASKSKTKPTSRSRGRKIRQVARGLAQTTLMAAALAASQFSPAEREPSVRLFNAGIVDRLHEPLSRFHE